MSGSSFFGVLLRILGVLLTASAGISMSEDKLQDVPQALASGVYLLLLGERVSVRAFASLRSPGFGYLVAFLLFIVIAVVSDTVGQAIWGDAPVEPKEWLEIIQIVSYGLLFLGVQMRDEQRHSRPGAPMADLHPLFVAMWVSMALPHFVQAWDLDQLERLDSAASELACGGVLLLVGMLTLRRTLAPLIFTWQLYPAGAFFFIGASELGKAIGLMLENGAAGLIRTAGSAAGISVGFGVLFLAYALKSRARQAVQDAAPAAA